MALELATALFGHARQAIKSKSRLAQMAAPVPVLSG
jgi:hypothetical protein